MRRIWLSACFLVLSTACDVQRNSAPPPPGYSGSVPSSARQLGLHALTNLEYVDVTGVFGGGSLEIGGFSVTPNPMTGKGPVMLLQTPASRGKPVPMRTDRQGTDGFFWVPIVTDLDAADFCQRVKDGAGARAPDETTSAIYRQTLGF